MDKKKEMNFNLNNFLLSVSDILDYRDIENNNISRYHSKRVAYIALNIAQHLNLQPKDMFNLCAYSLFHNYINQDNCMVLEIYDDTSILTKIVNFSHKIDESYNLGIDNIQSKVKIKAEFKNYFTDDMYEKKLIDIFLEISKPLNFWLDLQNENSILNYIYSSLHDFTIEARFEKVLNITSIFGSLNEDIKPLIDKCNEMADLYNFDHKDKFTFLISASLLNFGKLKISKDILEKETTLTTYEKELIKENVYYNKLALQSVYGFETITKWATRHFEYLDGTGYPLRLRGSDLSLKDRLLSIINIYIALTTDKPYRAKYSKSEAIKIMKDMGNKIDQTIVDDL